jgi:hypothetical protein
VVSTPAASATSSRGWPSRGQPKPAIRCYPHRTATTRRCPKTQRARTTPPIVGALTASGPATSGALVDFQRNRGLNSDGICGRKVPPADVFADRVPSRPLQNESIRRVTCSTKLAHVIGQFDPAHLLDQSHGRSASRDYSDVGPTVPTLLPRHPPRTGSEPRSTLLRKPDQTCVLTLLPVPAFERGRPVIVGTISSATDVVEPTLRECGSQCCERPDLPAGLVTSSTPARCSTTAVVDAARLWGRRPPRTSDRDTFAFRLRLDLWRLRKGAWLATRCGPTPGGESAERLALPERPLCRHLSTYITTSSVSSSYRLTHAVSIPEWNSAPRMVVVSAIHFRGKPTWSGVTHHPQPRTVDKITSHVAREFRVKRRT